MTNAYKDCVLVVTEGVSGVWHYHLSEAHRTSRALCDAQTMATSMPLQNWKLPFGEHFPKRPTWCEKCDIAAMQQVRRSSEERSDEALLSNGQQPDTKIIAQKPGKA
jgi:hypothetical protein